MVIADLGGAGCDEASECCDELAGLVEVDEVGGLLRVRILAEAELDRRSAHEVDSGGGDHFDRGHFGDVAHCLSGCIRGVLMRGGG